MTGRVDRSRFDDVRCRTEELAAPLGPEDQVVQSMPDCSPTKWHRAHTTWFFEEFVLGPNVDGYEVVDPSYRYLFNSYYEAIGSRQPRPRRGMITRPDIDAVAQYRRLVDGAMGDLLDAGVSDELDRLIELGLHHEQQHQELLLMDAKHLLYQNPFRPSYQAAPVQAPGAVKPTGWVEHPGGVVEIGSTGEGFSFDNEGPRHETLLEPFAVSDRLVTCGEWLEFLDDDGYGRPEFWLFDGWATILDQGWEAPLYWERADDGWQVFTLQGPRPIDPAEPVVHVSYYEADAFAHWRSRRLPTEAEWEAVAAEPDRVDSGLQPVPSVASDPTGLDQAYGQVWQWTSSAYSPYPGYRAATGAVGEYNGKFMVSQQSLRGSARVTQPGHARRSYRNFFAPHCRWAFSGLRLAADG